MKVFVAFGYNDRDKWIPEMVFPILEAFGIEVVTGEDLAGEVISEEVKNRIRNSDGLLAFLTRRDHLGNEIYNTHQWVRDEVSQAMGANRKFIEVWENGVEAPLGATYGHQRLKYNEAQRDKFLVKLVKSISRWAGLWSLRIRLLPGDFCDAVKPLLRKGEIIQCQYRYLIGSQVTDWFSGNLLSLPAGVVIDVNTSQLPPRRENLYIEVQATHLTSGKYWRSDYEHLDLLSWKTAFNFCHY
jgi:hypothetical protein